MKFKIQFNPTNYGAWAQTTLAPTTPQLRYTLMYWYDYAEHDGEYITVPQAIGELNGNRDTGYWSSLGAFATREAAKKYATEMNEQMTQPDEEFIL